MRSTYGEGIDKVENNSKLELEVLINKMFSLKLYQLPQTVFSFRELCLLFPNLTERSVKNKVYYAQKTGKLLSPRKGIYTKIKYDQLELANKIYTPSYISLETVLGKAGVVFQVYEAIMVASYLTREIKVGSLRINYRKLKDKVLMNPVGIEFKTGYCIASPERAFLDAVFLYKNYHFDNLMGLDWEKINGLVKLYDSRVLMTRVKEFQNAR